MKQLVVDPFWRMLLAVMLLVGLVMPAVAVPMVLMNTTTDVEAADLMNITNPSGVGPITVPAGGWVNVTWDFHSDQTGEQQFLVEIYNTSHSLECQTADPGGMTFTSLPTTYCGTYTMTVQVPIKTTACTGWYCVKVRSLTNSTYPSVATAQDIECDAVYIDGDPPRVELLTPDTTGNYRNSNTINVSWTMYDEGGIYNSSLWYSDDCGGNWSVIEGTDGGGDWWDGSVNTGDPQGSNPNGTYWHYVHVGNQTDGYIGSNDNISANETCHKGHIEVRVEDYVNLTNSSQSGDPGFTIDNTAPEVNIDYPTGSETWEGCTWEYINFTYSDNCGPLKGNISYSTSSYGGPWTPIPGATNLTLQDTGGTYNFSWHVPITINTSDFHIRVNVTDCPGNDGGDVTPPFRVLSPLTMLDAITGWSWPWTGERHPVNANDRSRIMVVFNKPLNLSTVSMSDFRVVGKTITDMQINNDHIAGDHGGAWQGFSYVFLDVMPIMATDETPAVQLVGCVSAMDSSVDPLCGNITVPITPDWGTQDGIAPIISVTSSPEEPGLNEEVTVTVTASECLNEAYLFISGPNQWPQDYYWNECKPIGWPTDWWTQQEWGDIPLNSSDRKHIWENETECCAGAPGGQGPRDCGDWYAMIPAGGFGCNEGSKTWTYTFFNTLSDKKDWFVEVAAHDFSIHSLSNPEMPFMPWKHEKWTEESLLFWSHDRYSTWLCEGWNLISFPGEPEDNTLEGIFGRWGGGVTAIHTYTTFMGGSGSWASSFLDPVSGTWLGSVFDIVPGKGYWVWCSPPDLELQMYLKPIDPLELPPSFDLQPGWNLIGTVDWGRFWTADGGSGVAQDYWPGGLVWLDWYFASLMSPDNPMVLWGYCACERHWYSYTWNLQQWLGIDHFLLCDTAIAPLNRGFWISSTRPITLFPASTELPESPVL
ncbi:hypothetical protein ACFLST_00550 [Chloroflexota bacterium]